MMAAAHSRRSLLQYFVRELHARLDAEYKDGNTLFHTILQDVDNWLAAKKSRVLLGLCDREHVPVNHRNGDGHSLHSISSKSAGDKRASEEIGSRNYVSPRNPDVRLQETTWAVGDSNLDPRVKRAIRGAGVSRLM